MKFITSALLAISAVSAAIIAPRQDASQDQTQQIASQYPEGTNAGLVNGTWYVTGVTDDLWDMYEKLAQTMNIQLGCLQLNNTATSATSFDGLLSAFLTHTNNANVGVNASLAGAFMLQAPDTNTNTSDRTLLWDVYGSSVYVNKDQWNQFTSEGQQQQQQDGQQGDKDVGSTTIPGFQPFQATVYSKLIDSNAQPGTNDSTNFDTVFLWSSQMRFLNPNEYQKRAGEVFGVILSRDTYLEGDKFNQTVALLPEAIAANNISIVQLNDTCRTDNNDNNNQQQQ
ncbi:hypothetical protein A0J61_01452 [Choanephora cucurbitarum]|uniref:Uncharacterized protein n=1 Tax=Choanephora cucurbitarum TaxID=101091 RepID=A0A1C7NN28_9FUNG|nr:hypothetical protein A0J61_01452 [Choanephora cucurbitarum]